jgi:hypothetical protein
MGHTAARLLASLKQVNGDQAQVHNCSGCEKHSEAPAPNSAKSNEEPLFGLHSESEEAKCPFRVVSHKPPYRRKTQCE